MNHDPNCVFCKIAAGQIPAAKVYEDDEVLAFLDIGPLAPAHTLLIPKAHYETLDQVPPELAAAMGELLPSLVRAVQAAAGAEGANVLQNNGRVAHQAVPHVHFHVIPRKSGDSWHFNWPAGNYAEGKAQEWAKAIRDSL